jgi:diguanylate cyclase (GGDEF)-like protein
MPITSQTGIIEQEPGTEYLHVAVDYLDDRFAAAIRDNYQLDDVAFSQAPSLTAGRASHAIFDNNGRLTTFFEWRPARPGQQMLEQTLPVIALAFLVAAVLIGVLIRGLWSSSSRLEAERVEARRQAMRDSLTGLANRRQFEAHLARDLAHPRQEVPTALLMLDLDRFKHVNDTFGHEAGDRLICAVGQRLRELVGPADIVARLGGDEFAVIHPCREADIGAGELADRIVEAMTEPFEVNGREAFVGASIGVAISAKTEREPRELIRKADISLFEAKARGRGRAQLYEPALGAQLQDRHQVELELRDALKRDDQLSVAFQPLVAADGEIVGVEALARWTHPSLGQVSPARFIPIAESAGLIEPLGEFVLRRACRFGARFPGRRVAVNISPAQLRNPRFPERVFDLMIETAMRPSDLELEITEGILLDHDGPTLEAITMLRRAGIRVALDDFGTGYSSLNYLKRYPVDCIKIDRSFVAQLESGTSSVAIVEAIITLAHALDIEVTAEGVETHQQLTLLKSMGCNLFQGFLLAPPAAEDVVEARFRRAAEHAKRDIQAA